MTKEMNLVLPPYPSGFDANAICDFHVGAPGHSAENYKALKIRVHDFIDSKSISFTPQGPNIKHNLLPGHVGPSVKVVEEVVENGC